MNMTYGKKPRLLTRITLRDICERVDYGYTASAKKEPIGPKFLRITDIVPNLIDWQSVPYCDIDGKDLAKYRLREGDIVIARTGATTGYAKRIKSHVDSVFASYLVRLRIKPEHDNRLVGLVVESEEYKRFIKANLGGAAQPQANAQVELPNQEAEILAQVDSPHIVKPIASDVRRGRHVLVTPFIEGENLETRLRREPRLTNEEIRSLAETLLEAAASFGDVGAVHLDIKPANIIVSREGQYFLVDFGAARFLKRMRNERILPARRFIAPEVLRYLFEPDAVALQQISSLSDVYGIGAVLYSAVTRRNLAEFFQNTSDVLQKTPPPVRQYRAEAEAEMADLIDKLIAKEPARRPRPEDAVRILRGEAIATHALPVYFLESKPRGEHGALLPAVAEQGAGAGVYWIGAEPPRFPRETRIRNMLWELPCGDDVREELTRQYEAGVVALVVPGQELENPLNADVLGRNISRIRSAIAWRNEMGLRRPLLAVLAIDESLATSNDLTRIRNAYAPLEIDGLVLRVCAPSAGFALDPRHLHAVRDLIRPWAERQSAVLMDSDMSALPLATVGVTGFIGTAFPRLSILSQRYVPPTFAMRPDGMFVPELLSIIRPDHVIMLRTGATGRLVTNCACAGCAGTLMQRNRLAQWQRPERRRHFVYAMTRELERIKAGSSADLRVRVETAQRTAARFPLVPISQPHLGVWREFLRSV